MLEIKNISKVYAKNIVLNDISFNFNQAGFYGLLGANGSGKSTLLSIISGVLKADGGNIVVNNKILKTRNDFNKNIAYVAQENQLINDASVYDNLIFFFDAYKNDLNIFLKGSMLDELNLRSHLNKKVCNLSEGMKKKLAIITSLANNAPIVVLDEPTNSLDIPSKLEIFKLLKKYITEGKIILMSSHDEFELKNAEVKLLLKNAKLEVLNPNQKIEEIIF